MSDQKSEKNCPHDDLVKMSGIIDSNVQFELDSDDLVTEITYHLCLGCGDYSCKKVYVDTCCHGRRAKPGKFDVLYLRDPLKLFDKKAKVVDRKEFDRIFYSFPRPSQKK